MSSSEETVDVLIVGAGHNGLVSAILLARKGLNVLVVEEQYMIGGCVRTEFPFKSAPGLAQSTGAYLFGIMPPELIKKLGVDIPFIRRDPHWFIPTTKENKFLLFGSNREEMKRQFIETFSEADWIANEALEAELEALRQDLHHTWLQEPLTIEETAEKYVRPELKQVFIDLCRKPIRDYLNRFGFQSDHLKMMYAATDGFSGLYAGWDTPGTGMNFFIHNMCRLPGADGTWMIVKGGMGSVTQVLAAAAKKNGARIVVNAGVKRFMISGSGSNKSIRGVILNSGKKINANIVVCNADPFRMRELTGKENLPLAYNTRLDGYLRDGSTMKINLCLKGLPTFKCLPENRGQFGTTTHILPQGPDVIDVIRKAWSDCQQGKLPEFPSIEWYIHTTVDKSIQDTKGHHSSALFVQWVPYELKGTTWEKEEKKYVQHMLSILDQFAPGTSQLVVETFTLTPPKLEKHFGVTKGHIHHIDNSFGFADRLPYATPIKGLYSCSAGCHPAGSVIGCAGHNAAERVIKDLESGKIAPISKL